MSQNLVILHTLLCPTSYEILTDKVQKHVQMYEYV